MLKTVWFVRFRDGVERQDAQRRWGDEHARLLLRVPGIVRYVQNVARPGAAYDGLSEVWWSDRSTYTAALRSAEWRAVLDDATALFDVDAMRGMSAEIDEHVMRAGLGAQADGVSTPPPGPVKQVAALRYVDGLRRDEASEYWLGTHGDLALGVADLGHYVQNHVARPLHGDGDAPLRLDGYSAAWFRDAATAERALASPEWKLLADDGPNLFDRAAILPATVEERVLRG